MWFENYIISIYQDNMKVLQSDFEGALAQMIPWSDDIITLKLQGNSQVLSTKNNTEVYIEILNRLPFSQHDWLEYHNWHWFSVTISCHISWLQNFCDAVVLAPESQKKIRIFGSTGMVDLWIILGEKRINLPRSPQPTYWQCCSLVVWHFIVTILHYSCPIFIFHCLGQIWP